MRKSGAKLFKFAIAFFVALSGYSQITVSKDDFESFQDYSKEYRERIENVRKGRPSLRDSLEIRQLNKTYWGIGQLYGIANIKDGIGTEIDSLLASGFLNDSLVVVEYIPQKYTFIKKEKLNLRNKSK